MTVIENDNYLEMRREAYKLTEESFAFLLKLGYQLVEKVIGESPSYKDGFQLVYSSVSIVVMIEYYDMELIITFKRNNNRATYLLLDQKLFNNISGYYGCMFPVDKLKPAIIQISNDIRDNYSTILMGDNDVWLKISSCDETEK